ncbi:hypothetical protein E1258_13785 [Micromonospora sp. KC207]|uniref:hypothetical protein n=1 Tax=Micromonospora sp. KC207 TaxID=2530377 RepID=UPI00105146F6|nr:hypothetical protein [Micromonospora sp. KC207]TDC60768.1 hypothetical protein E1258_13785 [Micromonospora sp. KC207]
MRTRTILAATAAATTAALVASPALAAPTDDTTATFDVLAGTLDIDAPATADLGSGAPGTTITGQLGVVTVSDTRATGDDASWTASVTSTDFTTGTATATETVPATAVDYWSGPATATSGTGTFTPGQINSAAAVPLDNVTPVTAFTHTGGTGLNSASWNPTLEVSVPSVNQSGTYTGTVTHSVA